MFAIKKKSLTLISALLLLSSAVAMADPITVVPVVTPNGSDFHYDYTIANATGLDLVVLDILVGPGAIVDNLAAPSGFQSAFDSGLGLVSFLEDSAVFGPSPLAGFMFDSPLGPSPTSFTATLADANFNLSTMSGLTTGPLGGPAAVPEPGSVGLLAMAVGLLVFYRRAIRLRANH